MTQKIKPRLSIQTGSTPGKAESNVRLSLRLLGLWLAAISFVIGVWGGTQTDFQALKWPFAALGVALFTALSWHESQYMAPPYLNNMPLHRRILAEPFLTGAALIGVGLALSSIFSPVPGLGLLTTLRESLFLILAIALFVHRPRQTEVRWVLLCLLVAAALQSALAIAQNMAPTVLAQLTPGIGERTGRAAMIGTMGNPEYLASWIAPAVAAAVILLLGRAISPREKIIPAAACLLGITMIFLSGGRGAVLSLFVGLGIAFFALRPASTSFEKRRRFKKPLLAIMVALTILVMMTMASLLASGGKGPDNTHRKAMLPQRLAATFDLHSSSMRHRIGLYTITGRMIWHNPVFGSGPGLFANDFANTQGTLAREEQGIGFWSLNAILSGHYSGEAHCDPLQWWAEYGLLPFLGLTLMLLAALGSASGRPILRSEPWLAAAWVALLVTFLTMWTSFPLHVPDRALTFWILLGLLAGAGTAQDKQNNPEID